MTHIITRLCLRDTACVEVCPVECMVLGQPEEEWPWLYIDPDTCIECGACVPECPYEAIFPEEEVPYAYEAPACVWINDTKALLPDGQPHHEPVPKRWAGAQRPTSAWLWARPAQTWPSKRPI